MSDTTLAERLYEAIRTLAALPDRERRFIHAQGVVWPEVLREVSESYGYHDVRAKRDPPTPEAIDRMLPTLMWLNWLDRKHQQIVTARAFGVPWFKIGGRANRSDTTVQRWHAEAMATIEMRLGVERAA